MNSTTTGYWYDGRDILADLSGSTPTATYIRSLSIDEPFIRKGASDEFFQTDALGGSLALTDTTGVAQATYTYESFGKTTITGTSANPFQYTGRESDATGLYYYRGRYYHPALQRFINEDRLRFAGGQPNLYLYVKNNPMNFKDPLGLKGCRCGEFTEILKQVGPLGIAIGNYLAIEATTVTNTMAGNGGAHNNQFDAFRHCYWSCRMTQKMNPDAAAIIGDLHEECDENQPEGERLMDSYNNIVGRTLGVQGADCRGACAGAITGGVLQNVETPGVFITQNPAMR